METQQQELQRRMLTYMSTFTRQDPRDVVDQIRAGDDLATQASNSLDNFAFRTKLCQAGLLDVLLDFLNVCNQGKSLADVL